MEVGGYIEFPQYVGSVYHEDAIALNSARNCLAYLIEANSIEKIAIPKFLCACVKQICQKYKLKIRYYSIGYDFNPNELILDEDEWLYLVNYYGQIENKKIEEIKQIHKNVIVDNVQAYFQPPVNGVDTIYTCRKYFGVSDGAFLYTNARVTRKLEQDKSLDRMTHLMGRYESSANEFYKYYISNEDKFEELPLRTMSKITNDLLQSIDYNMIRTIRERNYLYLEKEFKCLNKLKLKIPVGPFMYPLFIDNGFEIRRQLQKKGIYIPTFWADVFSICNETEYEYMLAKNILPLPCDQRYNIDIMKYLCDELKMLL